MHVFLFTHQDVKEFRPDIYLPCDRPVYASDRPAERRDTIRRILDDLTDVIHRLADDPVEIVPLVKGVTEVERQRCYRTFADLGLDRWAYYTAQYFLYGNRGKELVRDIHAIAREGSPRALLLVGLQSGNYLSRMPPEVFAPAGKRGSSSPIYATTNSACNKFNATTAGGNGR